jgi:hypothetical protein
MSEVCRLVPGGPITHLVTRATGALVRSAVAGVLGRAAPGSVLTLDFRDVGIVDFSCADELLAKLVTGLIAGEHGDRYLCLAGLTESQRENITVALERKRLPVLLVHPDHGWDCLGSITPYLRETLRLVMAREGLSAREMAGLLDLELTASSTRLINLHRQRLVSRRERFMDEGGREFVYEGLVPAREPAAERGTRRA